MNNPHSAGRAFPQPNTFLHYVLCCDDKNECSSMGCEGPQTYDRAVYLCKSVGKRLCTRRELDTSCCALSNCPRNDEWVWISKEGI